MTEYTYCLRRADDRPWVATAPGLRAEERDEMRRTNHVLVGVMCAATLALAACNDDGGGAGGAVTGTEKLVGEEKVFAVLPASAFVYGAGRFGGTTAASTPVVG